MDFPWSLFACGIENSLILAKFLLRDHLEPPRFADQVSRATQGREEIINGRDREKGNFGVWKRNFGVWKGNGSSGKIMLQNTTAN